MIRGLCYVFVFSALAGEIAGAQDAPPSAPAPTAAEAAPATPFPLAPPPTAKVPDEARPALLPPGQTEKIPNFFLYLKEKVGQDFDKPMRVRRKPNENLTKVQDYAFDAIEGLTTKDLIRAAREGAREARRRMAGQPEEKIERQVEENIRLAVEYYPLVAVDADALKNLYYIMEDNSAEFAFRKILFTQAQPGRGHDSLFAQFWQESLRRDPEEVIKVYTRVIKDTQEPALFRQLSVENLFDVYMDDLTEFLNRDAKAAEFQRANKRPLSPKDLKGENPFIPSDRMNPGIKERADRMVDYAGSLQEFLRAASATPQPVRDTMLAVLKRIVDEVPLTDPSAVQKFIDAAAPAPAAAEQKPKDDGGLAF